MRKLIVVLAAAVGLATAASMAAPPAQSAQTASHTEMKCHMSYTLSGWSIFYQTAEGQGTVNCSNGEHMKVLLSAKGGGITVGKYKITDGDGVFSGVTDIHQVLGSYAMANAHAGVVHSTSAMALTKGPDE